MSGTTSLGRRDFLQIGGSAAVGLAMAKAPLTAAEPASPPSTPERKKIRMAVVGGGFGAAFYWHEHPQCVVEAVSDLIPERRTHLMQTYRCPKSYESLEKLILDPNVDAVGVYTGAPDHVRHAVACLKAGKHVISAVPACMSLEEAELLLPTVKATGLTYMMCETSWYHPLVITARQWNRDGAFGEIFHTAAEYCHTGLESLFVAPDKKKTWRYGFAPMHYTTHCTAYVVGVTGERLTKVSCIGWGDDNRILKDNVYQNPFWNETAMFVTDKGHSFRASVYWNSPSSNCERGEWIGSGASLSDPCPNGPGAIAGHLTPSHGTPDGRHVHAVVDVKPFAMPQWWATDMLPKPLRHDSGHEGSHTFLTHEFIDALAANRRPAIDIYESLAMTVPGIVAHQSALRGGEQLDVPVFRPS